LTVYIGSASFSSNITFSLGLSIVVQAIDRMKFTTVSFLMLISLLAVSCASFPVQEMSDARQAIQAAKESGAPADQPNLVKAEALLKEAETALQEGDYKKAKHTAKAARKEALQAQKYVPAPTTTPQSP